ncbi:MAG: F0F1 ATP synthase subunit delta [Alkalilacustris sp.]
MSEPASISAGIAGRYATAIFDLAREDKAIDRLERDVEALTAALGDSADLRGMISSPIVSREDQGRAIAALAQAMKLTPTTSNALALMAGRRRLFVLPQMLQALRDRIAAEKGEITADVRTAVPLSKAQQKKLAEVLAEKTGKTVRLDTTVDAELIGGLVVKVGSRMIDTSIRSRLAALQNAMKEVG